MFIAPLPRYGQPWSPPVERLGSHRPAHFPRHKWQVFSTVRAAAHEPRLQTGRPGIAEDSASANERRGNPITKPPGRR